MLMQVTPHGCVRSSREPTVDMHQCNEELTKPAVQQRRGVAAATSSQLGLVDSGNPSHSHKLYRIRCKEALFQDLCSIVACCKTGMSLNIEPS